jgi:hypothetical protein
MSAQLTNEQAAFIVRELSTVFGNDKRSVEALRMAEAALRAQGAVKNAERTVFVRVVSGVDGPHLSVSDNDGGYRLAGPKAWGGGRTIHEFEVRVADLTEQAERHAMDPHPQGEEHER